MSYIEFDKNQLINLEYSLSKELLRSNRAGSYASTTIIGCNTRKYHGLLITKQPAIDTENHVLLSSIDETIIQHDTEFNLGIHKYADNIYQPKGHKYIRNFDTEPIPKLTYRVGGVVLTKERLFSQKDDRIIFKYTLIEANSPTKLKFTPYLAFRNIHFLSKANPDLNKEYNEVLNGITLKMYENYTNIFMQFSKNIKYTYKPDWYYNIEYSRDKARGYDFREDLYVPGYFEVFIDKGESIYFSAGIKEINPSSLKRLFNNEIKRRIPRNNFENCLENSAQQFIVNRDKKTEIIAGFQWLGRKGRDTFISLPGLTLFNGNNNTFKSVIDTMISEMNGPLFPNSGEGKNTAYNSVDAPLWFFWALQQYAEFADKQHLIWKEYGDVIQIILNGFKNGTLFNIKMSDNGLIFAGETGKAITWMNTIVSGNPVTARIGMPVEINALWYNAIMFSIEAAKQTNDIKFVKTWEDLPEKIQNSFVNTFWDEEKGYLSDYVNEDYKDWSVRPNMVFATSLAFSPVSENIRKQILDTIERELLTPRGLRTLSPKDPLYKGIYYGNQEKRDMALHQGSVFPWLLCHFAEGYLKIHGKNGLPFIKTLYKGFEDVMEDHGIGSISEVYDGNPPHKAGGTISQAWSVAELLRMGRLIEKYNI